jgi:hypothetical protein
MEKHRYPFVKHLNGYVRHQLISLASTSSREASNHKAGAKMEGTAWGWHKCNVDGAFFTSCNSGSTGVILRDHDGRFMAGRAT